MLLSFACSLLPFYLEFSSTFDNEEGCCHRSFLQDLHLCRNSTSCAFSSCFPVWPVSYSAMPVSYFPFLTSYTWGWRDLVPKDVLRDTTARSITRQLQENMYILQTSAVLFPRQTTFITQSPSSLLLPRAHWCLMENMPKLDSTNSAKHTINHVAATWMANVL